MNLRYVSHRAILMNLLLSLFSLPIFAQYECGHSNPKIDALDPVKDAEEIKRLKEEDHLSAIKALTRIKHENIDNQSINLKYNPENRKKFLRVLLKEIYYLAVEAENLVGSTPNDELQNLLINTSMAAWDFHDFIDNDEHQTHIRSNDFSFLGTYPETFVSFEDAYYNLDTQLNISCSTQGLNTFSEGCYSLVKYKYKVQDIVQTFQEIIEKVENEEDVLIHTDNYVTFRNSEVKRVAVVFHYVIDHAEYAGKDLYQMSEDIVTNLNKYFNSTNYFSLYLDGWIPPSPHVLSDDWYALNSTPNIEFNLAKLKIDEDDPTKATPSSGVEVRYLDKKVEWLGRRAVKRWDMGGLNAWDTKRYLNIWVSNDRDHVYEGGFKLLGSAMFPESYYSWYDEDYDYRIHDGVWMNTQALLEDRMANNGKYYRGKVIHHEVGHYFGLFHTHAKGKIFEFDDGCLMDDGLLDTPRTNGQKEYFTNAELMAIGGAPHPCGEDEFEMYHNFMGYSSPFGSSFTPQQVQIMQHHLDNERSDLLNLSYFNGDVSNGDHFSGFVGDYYHEDSRNVVDFSVKEQIAKHEIRVWPNAYSCKVPLNIEVSIPVYADRSQHNTRPFSIRLFQLTDKLGRVVAVIDDPENDISTHYESNDAFRKYRIQIQPSKLGICHHKQNGAYFFHFRLTDDIFGSEYHGTPFGGKVLTQF